MGFHQKDDLEAWGIAQVKAGKLQPEDFDRRVWGDWVSYYLEVRPRHSNVSNLRQYSPFLFECLIFGEDQPRWQFESDLFWTQAEPISTHYGDTNIPAASPSSSTKLAP
jgi:hypothetical protein